MKNKILLSVALAASSSALFAGAMGPVANGGLSVRPFISGEGLYSWPNVNGLNTLVSSNPGVSTITNQGWGGRLAAGLINNMTETFAYSGEMGWGYYGHTRMALDYATPLTQQQIDAGIGRQKGDMDRWGFDVLAGFYYTQPKFDLYAKGGALFQNMRFTLTGVNLGSSNVANQMGATIPEVLPEIKLGGAYHITNNLSATLSWMYAFGGDFTFNTSYSDLSGIEQVTGITASLQNSSMNVLMFGLEYRFG